jgi:hypothetical protein
MLRVPRCVGLLGTAIVLFFLFAADAAAQVPVEASEIRSVFVGKAACPPKPWPISTGPHEPALEVLGSLPRLQGNPYVIVGERPGAHLVNIQKTWARICKRAGLAEVRIHDLRHSYASVAVGAGVGLYLTGKILGHLRNATTERYAHLADDPVRQANELVGRRIAEVMQPTPKKEIGRL